ncbi:MAG: hypothetical protein GX777_04170 [Fastidiosipila sp.]|nr:hypothetical protein [Fastidiosipila sp.]
MKITYASKNVEKYFANYTLMQKRLSLAWVRSIKKHINHLEAAITFGDFLTLGLGKPESLSGYENITYSLRVTANVRLIFELKAISESIESCTEIEVKGVCDYHGRKQNWYIS